MTRSPGPGGELRLPSPRLIGRYSGFCRAGMHAGCSRCACRTAPRVHCCRSSRGIAAGSPSNRMCRPACARADEPAGRRRQRAPPRSGVRPTGSTHSGHDRAGHARTSTALPLQHATQCRAQRSQRRVVADGSVSVWGCMSCGIGSASPVRICRNAEQVIRTRTVVFSGCHVIGWGNCSLWIRLQGTRTLASQCGQTRFTSLDAAVCVDRVYSHPLALEARSARGSNAHCSRGRRR